MAWASIDDVAAILHEDEEEIPASGHVRERLKINLDEATDLVEAYLGRTYEGDDLEPSPDGDEVPDDVPGAVRRVVARVALRGFLVADAEMGSTGETQAMGPFSYHVNWAKEAQSGDFYLTDTDKDRLAKYRLVSSRTAGHTAMWSFNGPS